MTPKPFLQLPPQTQARAAVFLSGSGSNAEKILQRRVELGPDCPFEPTVLVTDAPETSRARELADTYSVPLIENDIRAYYRDHGETRVSIGTPAGQQIREQWTDELRAQLEPFAVHFGILAGFVPLTNLTADFPCLNVHPGDLTYELHGRRHLVGLHTIPVERAILAGLDSLRSSVIVAQPYSGKGDNMDSGPILGVSPAVAVDFAGYTLEQLHEIASRRPERRPPGGFRDDLETLAAHNQNRLKENGDWVVLPEVVLDFGRGQFAGSNGDDLFYLVNNRWQPIQTVEYGKGTREILFPDDTQRPRERSFATVTDTRCPTRHQRCTARV